MKDKEDINHGWISLHRKIQENWIFPKGRTFTQFEAWVDLLLNANHKEQKVVLKNELYICKRGQQLRSMQTLAEKWNWSRSKVRRFFDLLVKDSMVVLKADQITTQITICNYDTYQGDRPTDEHQTNIERTSDEHQTDINNNDNNDNNDNNFLSEKVNFHFEKFIQEQKEPISELRKIALIKNLERIAPLNDELKIEVIHQAIAGHYKDFRPLPQKNKQGASQGELANLIANKYASDSIPNSSGYESSDNKNNFSEGLSTIPPTLQEIEQFFEENDYKKEGAKAAFDTLNKYKWIGKNNDSVIPRWRETIKTYFFTSEYLTNSAQ